MYTNDHINNKKCNIDNDIDSFNNDINTNNCHPKNKSEVETNNIAGVNTEATTNIVQMTSLKKLAQIQQADSSNEVFKINLTMNTELGIACFYLII